jgi:cytochrome c oxidase assembly protein subunit 15
MRSVSTENRGLHRFAVFTACVTFLLIVAGGLVTGKEAGLSVPDWPLSYGSLMPPMVGNIRYEHTHRMIAALVGALTLILAVWLWQKEERKGVRLLGLGTLLAVIIQGILGGITVIYLLPLPVSVGHACLAQMFFCMVVSLALLTSPGWKTPPSRVEDSGSPRLQILCLAVPAAIFIQLVLGATLRHSQGTVIPHLAGALIVSILVIWTSLRVFYKHPQQWNLVRLALLLVGLLFVQLLLGTGSYMIRLVTQDAPQPTLPLLALTTAHVAAGALIFAIGWALALEAFRTLAGRRESTPAGSETLTSARPLPS